MISEDLEFRISQYADGTLAPEDVPALKAILRSDPEAAKLLDEYRRLDDVLQARLPKMPAVKWTAMEDYLSSAIETEATERSPSIIMKLRWPVRMALAAAVLLAIGLTATIVMQSVNVAPVVSQVHGPQAEESTGQAIAEVEIGPAPSVAERDHLWQYADGFVTRPSRVTIAGEPKSDRPQY
jgi:anti-sigma factor RsiW